MKILNLLLLLLITIGGYCSSQNHTTSNILNQLIAAIDELCTTQPDKCGPKSVVSGIPITVNIGIDELNNYIKGTIFDIIPELRKLSNEEANAFFKDELFPVIKEVIEELGVNMFDRPIITDEEANDIIDNIRINLRNKDVIAELLNSNSDLNSSPSLFSDNYIKKLFIYPKNSKGEDYIKEIIKYVNDNSIDFPDNKGNSNYSNLEHLDESSYINEPIDYIDNDVLKNIFELCRDNDICKSYFANHSISKNIHFSIFKSIINGIERYHLLINDSLNKVTTAIQLR